MEINMKVLLLCLGVSLTQYAGLNTLRNNFNREEAAWQALIKCDPTRQKGVWREPRGENEPADMCYNAYSVAMNEIIGPVGLFES